LIFIIGFIQIIEFLEINCVIEIVKEENYQEESHQPLFDLYFFIIELPDSPLSTCLIIVDNIFHSFLCLMANNKINAKPF